MFSQVRARSVQVPPPPKNRLPPNFRTHFTLFTPPRSAGNHRTCSKSQRPPHGFHRLSESNPAAVVAPTTSNVFFLPVFFLFHRAPFVHQSNATRRILKNIPSMSRDSIGLVLVEGGLHIHGMDGSTLYKYLVLHHIIPASILKTAHNQPGSPIPLS